MRLDQLLAQSHISRKTMKQAFLRKKITVDGCPASHLGQNVDTGLQEIRIDQKILSHPPHRYYMLNKPAGVVTANSDAKRQTVMDLLSKSEDTAQLYAIGRLDRDTRGLLLITDNGPLGFQLLHPDYHVKKTYYVQVNGLLSQENVSQFQKGITFLDGQTCKPAQLTIHQSSDKLSSASLTIWEGKFHQVKKMFLVVGVKVTYLQRTHFGDLELDPHLAEGDYRPLNPAELEIIKGYLLKS